MNGTTNPSKHLDGVEETVKDFWASRPRRPHQDRKLAGVAVAVGNRYGIDPIVIRVTLVAMTIFGGIGITVYLLGWLLFPGQDDEVSAFESLIGQGRSSVSKAFALVLCLLLVPVTGWTFAGNWFDGGGFIGMALVVTAIYLLHRSRGHLNRPIQPMPGPAAATAPYPQEATMPTPGTEGRTGGSMPQGWDPLGAAPLAWDLPQPAPASPPPAPAAACRRRRSKIGFATFGVALAVGGVGAALVAEGEPWFTTAHVIGLVLGVVGAGMVLGAFLGGGRGLLALAIPLSLAGLLFTNVPVDQFRGGVGSIHATPRTVAEVQSTYQRTVGEIVLDLRDLESSSRPVATVLRNGAGSITVIVPPEADVTYTCDTSVGNVSCFGREQSGVGITPLVGVDVGTDGRGGQQISLDVSSGTGNVEVHRG